MDGWLRAVQLMETQVEEILQNGDQEIQNKCLGSCPKNCRSSYKLGKIVTKKIDAVTELKGKGRFDVVAHRLPCDPVDERPMGKTVGLDLMFDKVRECLEDEKVRSIGLYGIGGVGKTTLLQKINSEYFGTRNDFDVVIWIVVSKPISIEKIQRVILKKLEIPDEERKNSSKEEKAARIFRLLKAKKFAILLDDMWERLDLLEVGIPHLSDQSKSKVVLTTRSEIVCNGMEVDKRLKIKCLTPDEAFSLFCDKAGYNLVNSHPHIRRLAKIVVEECKGLPLALIVIGRSMANRKTPRDWEQAIQALKSYPANFAGDVWEGTCKMHDVIRDMALWFSCDNQEDQKHKTIVLDHIQLIEAHETVKWKDAQRIALWDSNINEELSLTLCFLNLQTMILRNSKMKALPTGFFQHMPVIRVLDLEDNGELEELPLETYGLESLEYLNLRLTSIEKMPTELKNLTKLRCLILDYVFGLEVIAPNVICCLSNLQMFSMILDKSDIKTSKEGFMVSVLQELECLQYLREMSITLPTLPAIEKFLTSQKLQKCIRNLHVILRSRGLEEIELPLSTFQRMKSLTFEECYSLERVKIKMGNGEKQGFSRGLFSNSNSNFFNLVRVQITGYNGFLDLTWLIYAPSLERLMVNRSDNMREIIGSTDDDIGDSTEIEQQTCLNIFSRLEVLCLEDLRNLNSIHSRPLPFPSLKEIVVVRCPNLRKLPLNSSSATNTLQSIAGKPSWWKNLEWEDDNLKHIFTPFFKELL